MRKLNVILTVLILAALLVPAVFAQDPAQDVVGNDLVAQPNPDIAPFAVGEARAVPTAPNPEDVLWDQYNNWSGVDFAAQDFESSYDAYDIWAGDDFENLEDWTIDTIVGRGGWGGYVNLANATAIHWYICADNAGLPGCVPGDGTEFWTAHLAPTDPQVSLGVYEAEDFILTLDTPVNLPAGTWWIIFQVSLEYTYYGQYGTSSTADPAWGHAAMQINPNGGFGYGSGWFDTGYGYDLMFRLEGTTGGMDEPDIYVDPPELVETLCPDAQTTVDLWVCNEGGAELYWSLTEMGGALQDVLYDNGPLVTHPGGGYGGADASVLQTNLGLNTYGFGHQYSYNYRVADDFVVDADWTVEQITFFAYQTNAPTDPSTFLGYNLAVWDGVPGAGGSIIWGDYVTNCMVDTGWMGAYRVTDYDMMGTARPIMANVCATPGLVLPPGQYWLDWQADGSLSSGPWAPPISILGETTTGDALQSLDGGASFAYLVDSGTGTGQGLPFIIEGTAGGEPGIPWLSEDPTAGEVAPGECQLVSVTFDSTGLAPDTYTGELLIESNDPDEPEVYVPVTLIVDPCADSMHVADIQAYPWANPGGFPAWVMGVRVVDGNDMPLAQVFVEATVWIPGDLAARDRYSLPNGWARFWAPAARTGNYQICVDNLTLAGYTYNPDDNVVTCMDWDL